MGGMKKRKVMLRQHIVILSEQKTHLSREILYLHTYLKYIVASTRRRNAPIVEVAQPALGEPAIASLAAAAGWPDFSY